MPFSTASGRPAIFHALRPLYLASSSPRRVAFFESLGLPVTALTPPEHAEPCPNPGEDPETYALRAALAKASGVFSRIPPSGNVGPLVIAADTVVVIEGRILGKPIDSEQAFTMLSALAGHTHTVITGCALLGPDLASPRIFSVSSLVEMWNCPPLLLRAYAGSGEPMDKAGAYAVQGAGAFLVKSITGSWSNVVGLPLAEMIEALLELRAVEPWSFAK